MYKFDMVSLYSPNEFLEKLKNEERIDKDYILNAIKNGIKILPYGRNLISDKDSMCYKTYISYTNNRIVFYTLFLNIENKNFICGYKYYDDEEELIILRENLWNGNPLNINYDNYIKRRNLEMAKKKFPDEQNENIALRKYQDIQNQKYEKFLEMIDIIFSQFTDVEDVPFNVIENKRK